MRLALLLKKSSLRRWWTLRGYDWLAFSTLVCLVFPKLCAAAHWCAAEEAEVCRESFMFWQNLLYVTLLPLQSLWRVGFYKVGVLRPNPVFIIVCRNEIKFEKRWSRLPAVTEILAQRGPTTDPPAACGPPQGFQWPAEAFRKNLPIWNLLNSVRVDICLTELLSLDKVPLYKNNE